MACAKELGVEFEWRENMADGSSRKMVPEHGLFYTLFMGVKGLIAKFFNRMGSFFQKAWSIGITDPKKVIHCLKVGLALSLVSLFYYMRPLYEGVGGNAMWAVMTVVVVFEYTVGATLSKCINRTIATFLAGSLGIGVHWVASQSGEQFEPIIVGVSVFILAFAASFSRFIPSFKARFDYGALIFILTFSLVSVSGYRVEKLFEMAHHRLSTIVIGTSMCILISMLLFPVWAGNELHLLVNRNIEKLADSLDGCVMEYFNGNGDMKTIDEVSKTKMLGYRCALNSKATEEAMANFARWEPAHGNFNFRHPWKQYLKVGAAMRSCACCIESLNSCIVSEIKVPEHLKKNLSEVCMRLSSHCSRVLKESAESMKTMTKSTTTDSSLGDMNYTVQELHNAMKSLPNQLPLTSDSKEDASKKQTSAVVVVIVPLIEILPLATVISLLIEVAARIEGIVDAVDELADLAEFKAAADEKSRTDDETMKVLQKV